MLFQKKNNEINRSIYYNVFYSLYRKINEKRIKYTTSEINYFIIITLYKSIFF